MKYLVSDVETKEKKLQNKNAVKYERKGCAAFRGATPPPTYKVIIFFNNHVQILAISH